VEVDCGDVFGDDELVCVGVGEEFECLVLFIVCIVVVGIVWCGVCCDYVVFVDEIVEFVFEWCW